MTRIERCGLSTLLSFTIAVGAALAQQPGGPPGGMPFPMGGMMGGPGGGGDLQLVSNAAVQKDIDLTAKQKGQLRSVEEAAKSNAQEIFASARENGFDPMAIGEQMTAIRQDVDAKVGRVLDKKQKARLGQIKLQREGLTAVSRSEVSSKLKITNPQSKQIKKVVESMNKEIAAAMPAPPQGFGGPPGGFPGGGIDGPPGGLAGGDDGPPGAGGDNGGSTPKKKGGNRPNGKNSGNGNNGGGPGGQGAAGGPGPFGGPNFEEMRTKMEQGFKAMAKSRESAVKQIEDIMTDDQKAAWAKLIGEPFDLSALQPPPGGPGGPGGPRDAGKSKKAKKEADDGE